MTELPTEALDRLKAYRARLADDAMIDPGGLTSGDLDKIIAWVGKTAGVVAIRYLDLNDQEAVDRFARERGDKD